MYLFVCVDKIFSIYRMIVLYIFFIYQSFYSVLAQENFIEKSPQEKFIVWQKALNDEYDFSQLLDILEELKFWPRIKEIQEKAEKLLNDSKINFEKKDLETQSKVDQILIFFDKHPPTTGKGQFIFAQSLLYKGRLEDAKNQFIRLVNNFHIPEEVIGFLPQNQKFLPFNWAFSQVKFLVLSEKFKDIKPYDPFLNSQQKKVLNLYLKLLRKKGKAYLEAYEALKQPGDNGIIVFQLIKLHLKRNKKIHDDQAFSLFQHYSFSEESTYPDLFFKLRYRLARNLMSSKEYQKAFELLKQHKFSTQEIGLNNDDGVMAYFLPSWLAIEFCNNPMWGIKELKKIENNIISSKNKAKILFWIGKAYAKIGYGTLAVQYFVKASQMRSSFYGYIAYALLKRKEFDQVLKDQKIDIQHISDDHFETQKITDEDQAAFDQLELVQVLRFMKSKNGSSNFNEFFDALITSNTDSKFYQMVLRLAQEIQGEHQVVRLSVKKGLNIRNGYPLLSPGVIQKSIDPLLQKFPKYPFIHALTHSVIRQESYFNPEAQSIKAAKGLMQLLKSTAKREKKRLKRIGIRMKSFDLFNSKDNVLLGVSHLISLLEKYHGNAVLTLAAYNAGEGSVEKWIKAFGDPNDRDVNILNWMETIPFKETREYVQKVLESILVYEQILVEKNLRKKIDLDLVDVIRPKL